jgi:mitogen-activated protein kinase 7
MADLQGRKVFKVFNQDFIVDERYTVTKELGQGAYGIVWYDSHFPSRSGRMLTVLSPQRRHKYPNQ